jgi:hypothetical protein
MKKDPHVVWGEDLNDVGQTTTDKRKEKKKNILF